MWLAVIMDEKRDIEIRTRVLLELEADPRIGWTEIAVEVRDGVATLKGAVRTYAKKMAAAEAAHRVADVFVVVNRIEVTGNGVGFGLMRSWRALSTKH